MNCKQVDQILVDYIYEEIDPAEVATIENHLKACPRCAEEVESFQQTRSMVGEFESLEPPAAITQLLIEEAQRAAPDQQSFFARLRSMMRMMVMHPALSAAAMLVVVLGISFFAYRKGLPPARREVPSSDTPRSLPLVSGHGATVQTPTAPIPESNAQPVDKNNKQELQRKVAVGGLRAEDTQDEEGDGYRYNYRGDKAGEERKSGLRTKGPTNMEVALSKPTRRARRRPKTVYPQAQEPAKDRDATFDQLERQGAGKGGTGTANAEVVRAARPKYKKAPALKRPRSALRARTRRQASTSNVGSGRTGPWGSLRGQPAPAPAATRRESKADDAALPGNRLGAKDGRSNNKALLAGGRRLVRAGQCEKAFSYYVTVLKTKPALIDQVAIELGPCVPQLRASKQHKSLAQRVERSRARFRARRRAAEQQRKKASKARQKPAKATTAH